MPCALGSKYTNQQNDYWQPENKQSQNIFISENTTKVAKEMITFCTVEILTDGKLLHPVLKQTEIMVCVDG